MVSNCLIKHFILFFSQTFVLISTIYLYDVVISLGLYDTEVRLGLYDAEVSLGLYDGSFGVFKQK